ncbi:MAG: hypothetical protein WAL78_03470 [Candidatus Acidiferrales bacterium]
MGPALDLEARKHAGPGNVARGEQRSRDLLGDQIFDWREVSLRRVGVPQRRPKWIDPAEAAAYTETLKMNTRTAQWRYSYYTFTYRYPYGLAAEVKRMRSGDFRM